MCDIHEHVGQEIPCVVAATKCNVSECKREVTVEQAARYTDKNRMSLFEIVTLDKQTLDSLFYDLIDKMIKSVTTIDALENKDNVNIHDTYHRNTTKCSC